MNFIRHRKLSLIKCLIDIDVVEIEPDFQKILKGKGYKLVYDDFLTFEADKHYDLIIMNPPFSNGDKHLLKALEMQENGGEVIAIVNAETIRNPFSNRRKELVKLLEEYNAEISYLPSEFTSADRTTNVEVAMIKAKVPCVYKSDILKILNVQNWSKRTETLSQLTLQAVTTFKISLTHTILKLPQARNL